MARELGRTKKKFLARLFDVAEDEVPERLEELREERRESLIRSAAEEFGS